MIGPRAAAAAAALFTLLRAGAVQAHDTWFEARAPARAAVRMLWLGTGNRFPRHEHPIGPEQVERGACASATRALTFTALRYNERALLLRAEPVGRAAVSCWAQLVPFDVEITPDKVALYLDDIHAGEAIRARWAGLQAQGLPWQERYTKCARIELASDWRAPATQPSTMAADLRFEAPAQPVRRGRPQRVRALRDGEPLPGQWLELVDAAGASAGWQQTDDSGRITLTVPHAGRWLLRGVDLRPEGEAGWVSRFVTLAFDAGG